MTTVHIKDNQLIIRVKGLDKILGFKSKVVVPLTHVVKAEHNTQPLMDYRHSAFGIGTIFAGKLQLGTFTENGETSFWNVRKPERAILIDLQGDKYSKMLIEVADGDKTITLINEAVIAQL